MNEIFDKGKFNVMTISGLFVLGVLGVVSCKKDNSEFIGKSVAFDEILDMKQYQYSTIKVNDSVTTYKGSNNDYRIKGQTKHNLKYGWWEVIDKHNYSKARFEMIIVDNQEYVNQYIYFGHKGDTLKNNSLYYRSKQQNNTMVYHVHFPISGDEVAHTKFFYIVNNQELPKEFTLDRKEIFTYQLQVPADRAENVIKGMFTIATVRDGEMGVKNLYTLDTVYTAESQVPQP